jgi:type VI secretion system secreted protein VgrG
MSSTLKQDPRIAKLTTPFGDDVLVMTEFDGTEGLSELFDYRIDAIADRNRPCDFDQAIGRACSVRFKAHGKERIFHGILTEGQCLGVEGEFCRYKLRLQPWTWLLSRTSDCRIWKNKTAPEIIEEVFRDRGFSDFKMVKGDFPKLEYCVQFRETDLAFVTRLMEWHGIYFFFKHTSDKHEMVLVNSTTSHPSVGSIPFIQLVDADRRDREHIYEWSSERRFRTGKVEFNDYDHEDPNKDLLSRARATVRYTRSDMEHFDHPGKYKQRSDGEQYAKICLEAEQAVDKRRYGSGEALTLFPGSLADLEKHWQKQENQQYLVVRASHAFTTEAYRTVAGGEAGPAYTGSYEFLPGEVPFRAPIVTPRPYVHGSQTAKVVGKEGEEIDVDDLGRILVQFFWDRKKTPSRRVRVAQCWSGKRWGGQFIPRIGMEVVVDFEEGDPDRPLVVGTVYNGEYKHPYDLPGQKSQSGVKSNSTLGGNGYNEFMFEDKKGSEFIRMHAEKDHNVTIKNDETTSIGHDQTETIGHDRTVTVANEDVLTVGGSQTLTVGGSQTTTVTMGITTTAGGAITIMSTTMITLTVGPSSIIIDPSGVKIIAPTIALVGAGGVAIKGAALGQAW